MNTYIIPQDKLILVLSWSDRHCHQLTEKYMLDFLINIVEDPLYHKDKANPKIQKALYWLRSEIKHIETIPEGEERQFYFCRHYQANACRSLKTRSLSWLNRAFVLQQQQFQREFYNKFTADVTRLFQPILERVKELGVSTKQYRVAIREYDHSGQKREIFTDMRQWFDKKDASNPLNSLASSILDNKQWNWHMVASMLEPVFRHVIFRELQLGRCMDIYSYADTPNCLHVRATVNNWWSRCVADIRPLEDISNEPTVWY